MNNDKFCLFLALPHGHLQSQLFHHLNATATFCSVVSCKKLMLSTVRLNLLFFSPLIEWRQESAFYANYPPLFDTLIVLDRLFYFCCFFVVDIFLGVFLVLLYRASSDAMSFHAFDSCTGSTGSGSKESEQRNWIKVFVSSVILMSFHLQFMCFSFSFFNRFFSYDLFFLAFLKRNSRVVLQQKFHLEVIRNVNFVKEGQFSNRLN